ncbi:MAG: diaminopimelate decarboxylase [Treponema sp.]|jgi:diaminopimelate decarboxylase|nr:diaminopimelate decarboxylase [Treponema sp.]
MNIHAEVSDAVNFYRRNNPADLVKEYGSPLYVYNESILRERCRELKSLVDYPRFFVNYSVKANTSLAILKIVHEEGLLADVLSPGEMFLNLKAGFKPEEIFFVSNNAGDEEFLFAIERGILVSVDSVSQLERYGKLNPGGRVAVRFNPGVGAGHHKKVVTGGSETKFGVNAEYIADVKSLLEKYDLKLAGINQHIGSLFMTGEPYIDGVKNLLEIAKQFDGLEFIDIGGGLGIPYHKQEGEVRLDLKALGEKLSPILNDFAAAYGGNLSFKMEPGRYVVAECGVLLGKVNAIKHNGTKKFIGTDIGFNVLMRPVMYDAHHDIEIYRSSNVPSVKEEAVTIVGNICESGDILAADRLLPEIHEDDVLGVLDAGAYGYAMGSIYNSRPRPAEIMIKEDGSVVLTRKRGTLEQLLANQIGGV